jgi:hypothetical protein
MDRHAIDSSHETNLIETVWEMVIAVVTAAAIGVGVVSLAAHLSEVQATRNSSTVGVAMLGAG